MVARWLAFVTWAAVAASAVFWAFQLWGRGPSAPAHTVAVSATSALRGDVTRVLGAEPVATVEAPAPVPDRRFALLGVLAARGRAAHGESLALIAVDDKPARAYRVGSVVDGDTVLQSVGVRQAVLGPRGGAPSLTLEIPPLPAPATGTPQPTAATPAPPAVVPPMPGLSTPSVPAPLPRVAPSPAPPPPAQPGLTAPAQPLGLAPGQSVVMSAGPPGTGPTESVTQR